MPLFHALEKSEIKRAMHVYSYRKFGIYQHHGIVIGFWDLLEDEKEMIRSEYNDMNEDALLVVQQTNPNGLKITSLDDFGMEVVWADKKIKKKIREVKYGVSAIEYNTKLRGTCRMEEKNDDDSVVALAMDIYRKCAPNWNVYSLFFRNCEQFATAASINNRVSDQIDYLFADIFGSLSGIVSNLGHLALFVGKSLLRCGEALRPSLTLEFFVNNLSDVIGQNAIIGGLKGNAVSCGIVLLIEGLLLTARLFAWLYYKYYVKCEDHAIPTLCLSPKKYCKCMFQSVSASLTGLFFSVAGLAIGAVISAPCPWISPAISIGLGFLGYIVGRVGAGFIWDQIEDLFKLVKKKILN